MDFRNGSFDHKTYKSYDEAILKSIVLRQSWLDKYEKVDKKYANKNLYTWRGMFDISNLEEKNNKMIKFPEIKYPPPRRDNKNKNEFDDYLKLIGIKDSESNLIPGDAYPTSAITKSLLYQKNISSRSNYLKEREKISPEKRYKFPLCSSMNYGWRLSESNENNENMKIKSNHEIKNEIKNTFYRNNGIFD
jgi:hypothetical protein